jgi:hypothetical protein
MDGGGGDGCRVGGVVVHLLSCWRGSCCPVPSFLVHDCDGEVQRSQSKESSSVLKSKQISSNSYVRRFISTSVCMKGVDYLPNDVVRLSGCTLNDELTPSALLDRDLPSRCIRSLHRRRLCHCLCPHPRIEVLGTDESERLWWGRSTDEDSRSDEFGGDANGVEAVLEDRETEVADEERGGKGWEDVCERGGILVHLGEIRRRRKGREDGSCRARRLEYWDVGFGVHVDDTRHVGDVVVLDLILTSVRHDSDADERMETNA